MAVLRHEPWVWSPQLHNEINRVFGNLSDDDSSSATSGWSPSVDVREYPNRFQLLMDIPGVEPKDVEIAPDGRVLTVSGNRIEENAVDASDTEQPPADRCMAHE